MGKKLLVALTMEAKVAGERLQASMKTMICGWLVTEFPKAPKDRMVRLHRSAGLVRSRHQSYKSTDRGSRNIELVTGRAEVPVLMMSRRSVREVSSSAASVTPRNAIDVVIVWL
jgi:hypothetical protein